MVISFACLVRVRRLCSNMPVLYHVNGNLQRAYCPEQIEIVVSKTEIAVTLLGHHTNEILDISDWHGIQNPSSTDKGWNPVPGIRNL